MTYSLVIRNNRRLPIIDKTMIKEDQINFIREKCIEANPESFTFEDGNWWRREKNAIIAPVPIRLADVLLAIGSGVRMEEQTSSGQLSIGVAGRGWTLWNLRSADLRDQSEETIEFLYNLLK
jgi:hypothetical protein